MEQERVQGKLQVYEGYLKTKRSLKRFERILVKKENDHEKLSETYGLYEKMDAEAKERCVEKEKENVLKQVKQLEKEIKRCQRKIKEKQDKACDLSLQL